MIRIGKTLQRRWWILLILAGLGGYWFLPISGKVLVIPGDSSQSLIWPQINVGTGVPGSSQSLGLQVSDVTPWTHVLLTVDGQPAKLEEWWGNPSGTWTWRWTTVKPNKTTETGPSIVRFYRDCDSGCVEQGQTTFGGGGQVAVVSTAATTKKSPTKLGLAFANPDRNWHNRSGWDVELTYARTPDKAYWGIDDLAARVYKATAKGHRVLVRVDYDQGQSLPPANDQLALTEYLRYLQRLARDDRLKGVYGYIIGSGFNALDSNSKSPELPVTPEWYARLFNGYGESVSRSDNVMQTIRAENLQVRVLVGPVRPWNRDQEGTRHYTVDVPWLNYMNTLVAALDEGARAKMSSGSPLAAPDGFAIQAPGRPGATEIAGRSGAEEPLIDLQRTEWGGAQAGFRIHQDWLSIINAYGVTRGLPVFITSANTFAPDEGTPPAQNYPKGWLTNALKVANDETQIQALVWFNDGPPGDKQWEWFNLSLRSGRLADADEEFDALLQK